MPSERDEAGHEQTMAYLRSVSDTDFMHMVTEGTFPSGLVCWQNVVGNMPAGVTTTPYECALRLQQLRIGAPCRCVAAWTTSVDDSGTPAARVAIYEFARDLSGLTERVRIPVEPVASPPSHAPSGGTTPMPAPNHSPGRLWTPDEVSRLMTLHSVHGNKWVTIASHLRTRTPKACKRQLSNQAYYRLQAPPTSSPAVSVSWIPRGPDTLRDTGDSGLRLA